MRNKKEPEFAIAQIVYHAADELQRKGIITAIIDRGHSYTYYVAFGLEGELECQDFEISTTKQY